MAWARRSRRAPSAPIRGPIPRREELAIPRRTNPVIVGRRIERLLWRAGFGPRPRDLRALAPLGVGGAIDALLAPPRGPELEPGPLPRVNRRPLDPLGTWGHDVLWWLDRAIRARHQLVERMTLNLHDHFATSNAKVGDTRLMLAQYRTLRRHALGNFRALSHAILNDHAMQVWLDLVGSEKGSPNENFAREHLELFTLGVNDGYTERDVRESARALTGFTFDWTHRRFGFDPSRHDGGVKRILGRTGRFRPHDVVDLAIDHPGHALFLCAKLWGYFSPEPCPRDTLRRMAAAYRSSGTELRPVLRIILADPAVSLELDGPGQVKPPFVYVAGMLRALGRGVRSDRWTWMLDQMGQMPFYPPNVSGWPSGDAWVATDTIRMRFQAAASLIEDAPADGQVPKSQTPAEALAQALEATGGPSLAPGTRDELLRFAVRSVRGRDQPWAWKHYYAERQRVLRHVLLAGPDAQVS